MYRYNLCMDIWVSCMRDIIGALVSGVILEISGIYLENYLVMICGGICIACGLIMIEYR